MEKLKIFSQNNLYYLPDAILKIENFKKSKDLPNDLKFSRQQKELFYLRVD